MENNTEMITKQDEIYRELIANAIATLAGTETVVDDLSITKVIDSIMPVVRQAAARGWDMGRIAQVNGGDKNEYLNKYFPVNGNTEATKV